MTPGNLGQPKVPTPERCPGIFRDERDVVPHPSPPGNFFSPAARPSSHSVEGWMKTTVLGSYPKIPVRSGPSVR